MLPAWFILLMLVLGVVLFVSVNTVLGVAFVVSAVLSVVFNYATRNHGQDSL